jgi:hypothetical protein
MARFAISEGEPIPPDIIERHLTDLLKSSNPSTLRQFIPDSGWVAELGTYLSGLVELRVNRVRSWLDCNLKRFEGGHAAIEDLRRRFDNMVIELRTNVQFCGAQCASCNLICIRSRLHEGEHNCNTNHKCAHNCEFCQDDPGPCGTRYVFLPLSVVVTEESAVPGMQGCMCKWITGS